MSAPTDFARHLSSFLTRYLPTQRGASPNTVRAYRDAFALLLKYSRDIRGIVPERLSLDVVDAPFVLAFLAHLEQERKCSTSTRNQRLAAVRSYFRYLQTEEPGRILQAQRILSIQSRRCPRPLVQYLDADDMALILAEPAPHSVRGRRDVVLLSVLYDTAARCQEVIDLRVRDVRLDAPAQVSLTGKGGKTRVVPTMPSTVALLRAYLKGLHRDRPEHGDEPLFQGNNGDKLSRSGLRYIVQKYARSAKSKRPSFSARVSPHVLRHTRAMHLLRAGTPLPTIRDILGHEDLQTTDIYARADLEMKRLALERANEKQTIQTASATGWRDDQSLLAWLSSL